MDGRLRCFAMLLLLTASVLLFHAAAFGATEAERQAFWDEQGRMAVEQRAEYEARLRAVDPAEWEPADLENYLYQAMSSAYLGIVFYLWEYRELPSDPQLVFGDSLAGEWPGNPLSDWQPMRVLDIAEGFSAGDLCMQICPPDYYSVMDKDAAGDYITRPYNFELAVYGPTAEYAKFGNAAPYKKNADWAQTPEGALYMVGAWRETVDMTVAKWEARKQAARELREQMEQQEEEESED